jgi:DNA-binding NtrC family response regulator
MKKTDIFKEDAEAKNPEQKSILENEKVWAEKALADAAIEAQESARKKMQQLQGLISESTPFIGNSPAIQKVFKLIEKVANTDSTVLILGDSGTGKELVARALHERSDRKHKPFIPVNCGAIPAELLESELFGHVKGAFTGAHASRMGRFALAHNGTLFLDEIGTMPASLQVKILRALQTKEFEQVGGNKTQKSDCRVIAATNIDMDKEVANGNFREDLYYRLNVIPIPLPALKNRREDIPLLVEHFVRQFNEQKNYDIQGVEPEAMEVLMRHNWPGNVRELENICQRMCILKGEGMLEVSDIPSKMQNPTTIHCAGAPWGDWIAEGISPEGIPFDEIVSQFENDLILKALEQTRWNKNRAAMLLQMNRTTLVEKIKKRGLKKFAPGE